MRPHTSERVSERIRADIALVVCATQADVLIALPQLEPTADVVGGDLHRRVESIHW
jgi:hypothetical protein